MKTENRIINELNNSLLDNGISSRGGDFWKERLETVETCELMDLLEYTRFNNASAWMQNVMQLYVYDELKDRAKRASSWMEA